MAITNQVSRRRVLQLFAASAAVGGARADASDTTRVFHWRGIALGARAEITLRHERAEAVNHLFAAVREEIDRLENIFSLYRPDSALSRLNKAGRLDHPPAELLELLSLCGGLFRATAGAFDPAIQALWAAHADASAAGAGAAANGEHLRRLVDAAGWRRVSFGANAVTLASPGAALTFNGVAQGFITDRVADLMRAHGLKDVLVSAGEIAALGRRDGRRGWHVGLAGPDGTEAEWIELRDMAVATSAALGTTFDKAGRLSHILDPRTGRPLESPWRQVSVVDASAAIADGLSTGLAALDLAAARRALAAYPSARAIFYAPGGARFDLH